MESLPGNWDSPRPADRPQ